MKRKWLMYITRAVITGLGLWILLLAIAFVYIRMNKENIVTSIRAAVTKKISGSIIFDDLTIDLFQNFPGISIDVKNVQVRDSLFDLHKRELLHVQHIYMGFGIFDLLFSKKNPKYLTLTDGSIYFFADSLGHKNWDILKTQARSSKKIGIKKITFKKINAVFQDKKKFKFYNVWFEKMKCNINDDEDQTIFEVDTKAIIKNAFFTKSACKIGQTVLSFNRQFFSK